MFIAGMVVQFLKTGNNYFVMDVFCDSLWKGPNCCPGCNSDERFLRPGKIVLLLFTTKEAKFNVINQTLM